MEEIICFIHCNHVLLRSIIVCSPRCLEDLVHILHVTLTMSMYWSIRATMSNRKTSREGSTGHTDVFPPHCKV